MKMVEKGREMRVPKDAVQVLVGNGYTRDVPARRYMPRQIMQDLRWHQPESIAW